MALVRGEWVPILQNPCKKHPEGIEKGDHDDADGYGRCGMNGIGTREGDVEFIELDGHHRNNIPQYQRTRIAHEDLILFTKHIEDKEGQQGSHKAHRQHGPVVLPDQVKPCAKGGRCQDSQAGCEPVDAIHQVIAVGDPHNGNNGDQYPNIDRNFTNPQELMKVRYADIAKHNDDKAGSQLGQEFFKGGNANQVIFEPGKKDNEQPGHGKLELRKGGEAEKDEGGDGHPRKDGKSAQCGNTG